MEFDALAAWPMTYQVVVGDILAAAHLTFDEAQTLQADYMAWDPNADIEIFAVLA